MKNLLLLFFLFSVFLINAQTESEKSKFPNENNSYLTFDISTAANVFTPRYRFGYIQSINEKWRFGIDLGYGNDDISIKLFNQYDTENYEFYEARTELYHIFNPTRRVNHYISGELYYVNHQEDFYNDYYNLEDNFQRVSFDKAHFLREKYGFNLKYGVIIPFGEYVGMNAYIGIGPRILDIQYSKLVNPRFNDYYDEDEWNIEGNYNEEGARFGVSTTLGIKFFYKL